MGSKKVSKTFKIKLLTAAVVSCFGSHSVLAAPAGASVVNGTATITTSGSIMTVTNTPNAIINWASFGIATGETVKFVQQSSASAVLNRVTGNDPTKILGALQSNGKVFLINPNGIMFGAGARIDVNGLVASTLNITDADFLNGRMHFNADRINAGSVVNAGEISTPTGGFVYLLAPNVENSGVITAPSGEAILAAGNSVEIVNSTDPSQRVLVSATSQDINLSQLMTQSNGNIFTVLNSGKVRANTVVQDATGKIFFKSAGHIQTTSTSVIEAKGDINANGGKFIGFADQNGMYAGSFDTSGKNGGFIETSGHTLDIDPGISIKANALSSIGTAGLWLLDPTDILIDPALASSISTTLSSGVNVTVATTSAGTDNGDITITGLINSNFASAGTPTLFLTADRDIVFTGAGSIQQSGTGSFNSNLTALRDIVFAGNSTTNTIFNNSVSAGSMGITLNATNGVKTLLGDTMSVNSTSTGLTIVQVANGKTWTNNGTVNLLGKSQIDLDDGSIATFSNNGTTNIINNTAGWAFISNPGTQAGIINNNGVLNITGGTSFEALFNNQNSGVLNVLSGGLSLQNAGTLAGALHIASGASIHLSEFHGVNHVFDNTAITGPGSLNITASAGGTGTTSMINSVNIDGTQFFIDSAAGTFNVDNLLMTNGARMYNSGTLGVNANGIISTNFGAYFDAPIISLASNATGYAINAQVKTPNITASTPNGNLSIATLSGTTLSNATLNANISTGNIEFTPEGGVVTGATITANAGDWATISTKNSDLILTNTTINNNYGGMDVGTDGGAFNLVIHGGSIQSGDSSHIGELDLHGHNITIDTGASLLSYGSVNVVTGDSCAVQGNCFIPSNGTISIDNSFITSTVAADASINMFAGDILIANNSTIAATTPSTNTASISISKGSYDPVTDSLFSTGKANNVDVINSTLTTSGYQSGINIDAQDISIISSTFSTSGVLDSGMKLFGDAIFDIQNSIISASSTIQPSGITFVSQNLWITGAATNITADYIGLNYDPNYIQSNQLDFFNFISTATVLVDGGATLGGSATEGIGFAGSFVEISGNASLSATSSSDGCLLAGGCMHGIADSLLLDNGHLNVQSELLLEAGTAINLVNGGSIDVISPNTLFFNFPLLASGGWFVDGVANAFSGTTGSYIHVAGLAPTPDSNFFVTYGGLGLVTSVLGSIDSGLVDPGSSAFIDDSTITTSPTAEDFFETNSNSSDPAAEEQKEEDKPQQCSA